MVGYNRNVVYGLAVFVKDTSHRIKGKILEESANI